MKLFTPKQTKEAERSVLDELLRKEVAASDALKAKEAKLNEFDRVYPTILAQKQNELTEIETKLRLAREKQISEIVVLEERRKAALKPITEEQAVLQKTKDGIQEMLLRLDDERAQLQKERDEIRQRFSDVEVSERNLAKTQSDMLFMLEQRRKEADESVEVAKEVAQKLHDEQERNNELLAALAEQERNSKSAEVIARGAMAHADKQIARIQEERRKVTEERKLLAAAIKEAKKHGVWLTR